MDAESKVRIFEEKIEEYYVSCLPKTFQKLFSAESNLQGSPLHRFNILSIYRTIRADKVVPQDQLQKCADKLIDMKLMYCYLTTSFEQFYKGPTVIVGKNQLEKLNPRTISLLRGDHYKVYLISVLAENTLDFLQLIFQGRIVDHKKRKWERILEDVMKEQTIGAINDDTIRILVDFRENYRLAELHKFSAVRAFTANEQWNHFQVEEGVLARIISDLTDFFGSGRHLAINRSSSDTPAHRVS